VAAYIESNISLSFCVADLAAIAQLSISHFSRAFKVSFGQSPRAYVKVRRMRHAQRHMLNTREPLTRVALDCGMSDHAHFTRVFRQVVGINPSLWRRQFKSKPMSADDMLRHAIHEATESQITSHLVRRDTAATRTGAAAAVTSPTGTPAKRRSQRDIGTD
jgi:AraC-like DNA-binding protein